MIAYITNNTEDGLNGKNLIHIFGKIVIYIIVLYFYRFKLLEFITIILLHNCGDLMLWFWTFFIHESFIIQD